ncbi:MAG: hypothetical protein ACRCYE_02730 [Sarcina sp.]
MELFIPNSIFLFLGVCLMIISLVLWRTGSLNIISVYDDYKNYDERNLLKWIVFTFLFSGIAISSTAIAAMIYTFNSVIIFGAIICAMALSVGIGCSKYEK